MVMNDCDITLTSIFHMHARIEGDFNVSKTDKYYWQVYCITPIWFVIDSNTAFSYPSRLLCNALFSGMRNTGNGNKCTYVIELLAISPCWVTCLFHNEKKNVSCAMRCSELGIGSTALVVSRDHIDIEPKYHNLVLLLHSFTLIYSCMLLQCM